MPNAAPVSARSRRFARLARVAVLVGYGVAVAGCSTAIETVRSMRGINKNDPDPVTAPFSGNMAAIETAPYPNLASVPPPPSRATTAAERQNLTENLIAERAAAQAASGVSGTASPASGAAPAPVSKSQPGNSSLAKSPPAPTSEVAAPTATQAAAPATLSEPLPVPTPATAPPPTRVASAEQLARRGAASGEPAEPLPRDSELQMPQVRSLPEPDEPRPAPAAPQLPPVPPPAPAQLPPAALASATPQPPPALPQLAPIAPPPGPAIAMPDLAKPAPPRTSGPTTVATLDAPNPGQIDPAQITRIAARYRERLAATPPLRAIRVISYTAAPEPGADPLGGYHDALERAQGIAKVLTEAGIPEKMIQTEAKPAAGPLAASRVEIQFLP